MGRPSIFSKDYKRLRKKRRKKITIFITFIILVVLIVLFSGNLKTWTNKNFNIKNVLSIFKKDNSQKQNSENTSKVDNSNVKKTAQTQTTQPPVETGYAVTLSSGKQIKLVYEVKNNVKQFKYVSPETSGVAFSISPSGKNIVILDDKNQNLLCYDADGKVVDLTRKQYVSESGDVFNKDTVLSSNPSYIWHSAPAFIDDENIAYISQLPWFTKETNKYVWIVNIKSNYHTFLSTLTGSNITFGEIVPKGLTVNIDGNTYYLLGNGQITQ